MCAIYYPPHPAPRLFLFSVFFESGVVVLFVGGSSVYLFKSVDRTRRWNRWLFNGLHSGDFAAWARQRPLWDIFMLLLLVGVTFGSITGVYLGYKRITR